MVVITLVNEYNYKLEDIVSNILKNKHNPITTAYELLIRKKIREKQPTIGNYNSVEFQNYLHSDNSSLTYYNNDIETAIKEYCEKIEQEIDDKNIDNEMVDDVKEDDTKNNMIINSLNVRKMIIPNSKNTSKHGSRKEIPVVKYSDLYKNKMNQLDTMKNIPSRKHSKQKYKIPNSKNTKKDVNSNDSDENTNRPADINEVKVEISTMNIGENVNVITEVNSKMNVTNKIEDGIYNMTESNNQKAEISSKISSDKKREIINMKLDLNQGIFKSFLNSSMRKSVKQQYEKYVRKSISNKNNNFRQKNDHDNIINNNDKVENISNVLTTDVSNNFVNMTEYSTKAQRPIKKLLNTSVCIDQNNNDKNVSFEHKYPTLLTEDNIYNKKIVKQGIINSLLENIKEEQIEKISFPLVTMQNKIFENDSKLISKLKNTILSSR